MSRDWGFWQVVLAIIAIVLPLVGIHGFSPTTGSISVASSLFPLQ